MRRPLALAAGPLLFTLVLLVPAPGDMAEPAWRVAGAAGWMAVWWLSAVVPLEATALLPIAVFPLTGVARIGDVTVQYADPIIFLFLGGFLLAATLERWNLHRRFALATVRAVGTDAPRVVLAFMLASAGLSMWISNTATAVMMLPIAAAVVAGTTDRSAPHPADATPASRFPTALMLAVAYGASIGGVSTLIGTPPNAIMAGAVRDLAGREVSFAGWLGIGLSASIPMLAACWLLLIRLFRVRGTLPGLTRAVERERQRLEPMDRGERFVVGVFAATAFAWVFREPKDIGGLHIPGLTGWAPWISDPGIAIAAALILFVVPLRKTRFSTALDWDTASRVPWGILLLFGGGLALAAVFETSGLTEWVGARLQAFEGTPLPVTLLATAALFVVLTELTSNAATTALGMPLMFGVAQGIGVDAFALMATAALSASMAFMLPVATPPNAIVFGSGAIEPAEMARAGLRLNAVAVVIITLVAWLWLG